jgi:magnesium-transporting ATPase (P-type)
MLYLALCHSIIYDGKNTDCNFVSDSPDELALLEFAKQMDFVYIGKNKDEIINITNESKLH